MLKFISLRRAPLALLFALTLMTTAPHAGAAERFIDHGNGTVTDTFTGLVWLQLADAFGELAWTEAKKAAATLAAADLEGLDDGSVAGDWRLPEPFEMLSLTGAGPVGAALTEEHPFIGFPGRGRGIVYWTAGEGFYDDERAWRVHLHGSGGVSFENKETAKRVWAVRGQSDRMPQHAGRVPELGSAAALLTARERQRAELNALWDFTGLRLREDFEVVQSADFLLSPPALAERFSADGVAIATAPPRVRFRILPNLEPEYFPAGEAYQAGWANWAKITRSDDNRFFMAASDHRGRGAKINLYEYRPSEGEHGVLERALDVSETLGWHADMYTDGKIHGYMGIMPDGTLWAATHRGPTPTDAWWAAGYRGAWLLSYNIHTGEAVNWGVPLIGQELPSHVLDPERGIFLATGHLDTTMLCWDVKAHKVRYAGSPPHGWRWQARSMFLDRETGHYWGVDSSETPYRFLSFDPELNRFKRHEVEVPANPETGRVSPNRLHSTPQADDGWYYNVLSASLLRFRPDWEQGPEVEVLGVTYGDTIQTAMSSDKRYIYWVPRRKDTFLIMQYDLREGRMKALGFLKDTLLRDYGYECGNGVYGLNISDCGTFLVILDNGGFGRSFGGHPAVLIVDIPASERPVD